MSVVTPQPQVPILTVTLNPALDIATSAEKVVPDLKLRCEAPVFDAGGGGINVSRAVALMGGQSTAVVALAGHNGKRMHDLLCCETGLQILQLEAPAETRQSISVIDRSTGEQFRFVLPGPQWQEDDVRAALDAVASAAPEDGILVVSGSNPPGVPADFPILLAERMRGRDTCLFVDTSGEALAAAASGRAGPIAVLRMDDAEAEGLAGRTLSRRQDTADFASSLVQAGAARAVIIARGSDGNIVANAQGRWHAEAPKVEVVSKVGAGDSFVAGYALAVARGMAEPDALALGAAAAAAAVMTPATDLCRPEDVERLYAERVVTAI